MLICAGLAVPVCASASAAVSERATADTALVPLGKEGQRAFVAWPSGDKPAPAVIVVHEWWGLNAQIRRTARQLAQQGYVAIVPDLYHGLVAGDADGAHVLMRGLDDESAIADLDAAMAWLAAEPRTRGSRIGVMGFSMGGRFAQLMGIHSDRIAAVVMFYGRPVIDVKQIAGLEAPLMGHFGGADPSIPAERVGQLEGALKQAGKDAQIFTYAGAGHAFMNDERDSFHPDASRQAWARTLAFLQQQLKR
jgi:carboxymethylenebutenolidase